MDPLSIATAAGAASRAAWSVSSTLYSFISSAKKIDQSINALYTAIQGLDKSLEGVETILEQPAVKAATVDAQTHRVVLRSLTHSVEDCKHKLDALATKLGDVGPRGRQSSALKKPILQIKLNMSQSEIDSLRQHVQSHSTSVQIALHSLTLAVTCQSSQVLSVDFCAKFDQLVEMITNINQPQISLVTQELPPDFRNPIVSEHTRQLIQAAEVVISEVDTVMSRASSDNSEATVKANNMDDLQAGSEIGSPLDSAKAAQIRSWIPEIRRNESTSSDSVITSSRMSYATSSTLRLPIMTETSDLLDTDNLQSDECDGTCSSDDEDYEMEAINALFKRATSYFSQGQFYEAEKYLQRGLSGAEKVSSDPQRAFGLEEKGLELALVLLYQGKVDAAVPMLKSSSQSMSKEDPPATRMLRATHGLAQAYCCQNDYDLAEYMCRKTVKGWAKLFGKRSLYYKRSLSLLSFIKEMQGETEMASAYADLVSNIDDQGKPVIDTLKIPEGPSIEELCRLSRQMKESKKQMPSESSEQRRIPLRATGAGLREPPRKVSEKTTGNPKVPPPRRITRYEGHRTDNRGSAREPGQSHDRATQGFLGHKNVGKPGGRTRTSPESPLVSKEIHKNQIARSATGELHGLIDQLPDLKTGNDSQMPEEAGLQIRSCLSRRPDIEGPDQDGQTPLCAAIQKRQVDLVQLLLDKGANIDAECYCPQISKLKKGHPIYFAVRSQHFATVKLLLDRRADLSDSSEHARILKHAIMRRPRPGTTVYGDTKIIEILIESGVDVERPLPLYADITKCPEWTPLQYSIGWGALEAVETLLDSGAKLQYPGPARLAPLAIAIYVAHRYPEQRKSAILKLILQRGADLRSELVFTRSDYQYLERCRTREDLDGLFPTTFASHVAFAVHIGVNEELLKTLREHY